MIFVDMIILTMLVQRLPFWDGTGEELYKVFRLPKRKEAHFSEKRKPAAAVKLLVSRRKLASSSH